MKSLPNELHLMIYKQLHIDLTKRLNEEYLLSFGFNEHKQCIIYTHSNNEFMFNYRDDHHTNIFNYTNIFNIQSGYTYHKVPKILL